MIQKPKVVCLCGSTRFVEHFNEWRKRLTYEGVIVLSIEIVTTQAKSEDPQRVNPALKAMLDELHLRKIDLSDEIMVLNVGGYIGESTRREIEYAEINGHGIIYLEDHQYCAVCNKLTGRNEAEKLSANHVAPLCEYCFKSGESIHNFETYQQADDDRKDGIAP